MDDLQRAWDRAWKGAEERRWVIGRLGRLNADASVTIDVPQRPGYVYVALGADGSLGLAIAFNPGAVPHTDRLPIRMLRDQAGRLVIDSVDAATAEPIGGGGPLDADTLGGHPPDYFLPAGDYLDTVGAALLDSATIDFTYDGGVPSITAIVIGGSISNAKLATMAATTVKGRALGAGTGAPVDLTPAEVVTILLAEGSFIEAVQDTIGAAFNDSATIDLIYNDGIHEFLADVIDASITNAKLATMAAATIKGRASGAGTGAPVDLSATQVMAILGGGADFIEAAQDAVAAALLDSATIDFTYNDATPSITAIVIDASVTNAKLATMAQATVKGRAAGAGTGAPVDLTATELATILGASPDFTEAAQDAVGTILVDSATIDFTYTDATPAITAIVIDASITNAKLANMVQATIKGRASGAGTGVPVDLTAAQVAAIVAANDTFIEADGSVPLSANWDIGSGRRIIARLIQARDVNGISIFDMGGTVGLTVLNTGDVTGSTGKYIAFRQLRALDSNGLSLFEDGGTAGINISDNGDVTGSTGKFWGMRQLRALDVNGLDITDDGGNQAIHVHDTSAFIYFGPAGAVPQGLLHAHDGNGGAMFSTKTGVAGTAVVIIPDATGDVTAGLAVNYVTLSSGGGVGRGSSSMVIGSPDITMYSSGSDSVALRLNANGSVDVRRTGGALTYTVCLWLNWI